MRFRFTIRDLLWLTLVVALGLGWWLSLRASRLQLEHDLSVEIKQRQDAEYLLKKYRTDVSYSIATQQKLHDSEVEDLKGQVEKLRAGGKK